MGGSGNVYVGIWRDYSEIWIKGWNLTTTTRDAFVFVSFIAVGITLTGARSWKIIRFILHQSRRHDLPRDAMIREQESNLRTAESDLGSLLHMATLLWDWRFFGALIPGDKPRNSRKSTWKVLVLAFIHVLAFISFGILVPSIISTEAGNSLVLADSNVCAWWLKRNGSMTMEAMSLYGRARAKAVAAAQNYYSNCYGDEPFGVCNLLSHQRISWEEYDEVCPFWKEACLDNITAFALDTGPISPSIIGANSPASNSLSFRKKMTCVPLNQSLYEYQTDEPYLRYNLSSTFLQKNFNEKFFVRFNSSLNNTDYVIQQIHTLTEDQPFLHESLNFLHADIAIFVLNKHGIHSWDTVDDPIFAAHKQFSADIPIMGKFQTYLPDEPVTMLGCIDQFEYCNTRKSRCTGLWGIFESDELGPLLILDLDDDQWDVFSFITTGMREARLQSVTASRGSQVLAARRDHWAEDSMQLPLPSDQWKHETRHWFATSLAKLQLGSLAASIGPFYYEDRSNSSLFTNMFDRYPSERSFFCHNVTFRSSNHTTMNMAVIILILIWGTAIWVLSFADTVLARWMFRRWPHKVLAWQLDSTGHLLRLVHEHLRAGTWIPGNNDSHPLAYGTLGVPTLVQENGSQWQARLTIYPSGDEPLLELVNRLSGSETSSIVGEGVETKVWKLLVSIGKAVCSSAVTPCIPRSVSRS